MSITIFADMIVKKEYYALRILEIYKDNRVAETYNFWVDDACLIVMYQLLIVENETYIMLVVFGSPQDSLTSVYFRILSEILSISYMTIHTSLWEEMRRIGWAE